MRMFRSPVRFDGFVVFMRTLSPLLTIIGFSIVVINELIVNKSQNSIWIWPEVRCYDSTGTTVADKLWC